MSNGGHITRTLWCHLRSPPKIHPHAILHFKTFCGCGGPLSPSTVWEVPRTLVRHTLGCVCKSAPGISWGGQSYPEIWVTSSWPGGVLEWIKTWTESWHLPSAGLLRSAKTRTSSRCHGCEAHDFSPHNELHAQTTRPRKSFLINSCVSGI